MYTHTHTHTHTQIYQFSPIEELEEPLSENIGLVGGVSAAAASATGSPGQGDERGRQYHQGGGSYHDNSRRTTTSPRSVNS